MQKYSILGNILEADSCYLVQVLLSLFIVASHGHSTNVCDSNQFGV